jgi:ABC-type dipeptide/oligopeptide/nickel transport system ATPase component
VLSKGRVVEAGPVERVLTSPEHSYTQQLLADLPRIADPVAAAS